MRIQKINKIIYLTAVILPIFIFVSFLIVYIFQYKNERNNDLLFYKQKDLSSIKNDKIREEERLNEVYSDVVLLKNLPAFKEFLANNNDNNKKRVEDLFYQFSLSRKVYDQIRYLDKNGQEIIRVNFYNDSPQVISEKDLQNKKGRYYFDDSFKLSKDSIYVSPLDLNIEQNKIEEPYKPMLRIATPVFSGGEKKGIIIFNYLAQNVLDSLDKELDNTNDNEFNKPELLNKDGYWLKSNNKQLEWGFMFEDKKNLTLINKNPELWKIINKDEDGQILMNNGLYTFSTIYPNIFDQSLYWKIYRFTPDDILFKNSSNLFFKLLTIMIIILFILILAIFLTFFLLKKLNNQIKNTEELEEKFRAFSSTMKDAVVIMDDMGLVVLWNKTAEKMFGYSEEEMIGKEFHKYISVKQEHMKNENILKFGQTGESSVLDKLIELPVKNRKGEESIIELSVSKLSIGEKWFAIGVMRDISERKKMEDILKKSVEKSESALKQAERMNKLMVGREIQMIELKKKLLDLQNK